MSGQGQRKPTITSLANELGVSPKTVSNAFTRPDQLSAALRERVLNRAEEIGFAGPNPVASAFRRGATGTIGVVYANRLSHAFEDPGFVQVFAGLTSVLETSGYSVTLVGGGVDDVPSQGVAKAMMDGVVVFSLAGDDPRITTIRQRHLPVVVVDQPRSGEWPVVGIDDRAAMRDVAAEAFAVGRRPVGVISFAMNLHSDRRIYRLDALPDVDLDVTQRRLGGIRDALPADMQSSDIYVFHGWDSREDVGREGMRQLVEACPDMGTVVCLSDRLALGAVDVLRELDNAAFVTGLDGVVTDAASGVSVTVRQPHREKGQVAASTLLAQLRREDVPKVQTLPHKVIELRSPPSVSASTMASGPMV